VTVVEPRLYGCRSMTGRLRRVLVQAPHLGDCPQWKALRWRAEPDPVRLAAEHEDLCETLRGAGAEVVVGEASGLDGIYAFDPVFVGDEGAILLRPGKPERAGEPDAAAQHLVQADVPVAGRLESPAQAEGGDLIRLDERTLLAGIGYRTNREGVAELERRTGLDTLAFDLPHHRGRGEVMHLLSLLSLLDRDLVVGYPPLLPVRLVQLLEARGIRIVEVPPDELESMGPNVLALAPRVALALARNVETRRRMERAGVEVLVYRGEELSKGDGGPTCLTLPLLRD
jgi:N-dimethylarginine dimethylaminohydrolase